MVHTLVTFHVLPDKTEEFESLHRRLLELICAQPGCREVRVHRSIVDPLEYVVYGTWESKKAWERAHQTTDEFKSLFKRLPVEGHTVAYKFFRGGLPVRRDRRDRINGLNEGRSRWRTGARLRSNRRAAGQGSASI